MTARLENNQLYIPFQYVSQPHLPNAQVTELSVISAQSTTQKVEVLASSILEAFAKEFPKAQSLNGYVKTGFWDETEDWLLFHIVKECGQSWKSIRLQKMLKSHLDRELLDCKKRYQILEKNFDPTPGSSFLWTNNDVALLSKTVRANRNGKEVDWSLVKKKLDLALPKKLTEEQIKKKYRAHKQRVAKSI